MPRRYIPRTHADITARAIEAKEQEEYRPRHEDAPSDAEVLLEIDHSVGLLKAGGDGPPWLSRQEAIDEQEDEARTLRVKIRL